MKMCHLCPIYVHVDYYWYKSTEIKLHIIRDKCDIFIKYNCFTRNISQCMSHSLLHFNWLYKIKMYINMYHALFPKSVLCSFLWTAKLMSVTHFLFNPTLQTFPLLNSVVWHFWCHIWDLKNNDWHFARLSPHIYDWMGCRICHWEYWSGGVNGSNGLGLRWEKYEL